jgi:hypothetical protein
MAIGLGTRESTVSVGLSLYAGQWLMMAIYLIVYDVWERVNRIWCFGLDLSWYSIVHVRLALAHVLSRTDAGFRATVELIVSVPFQTITFHGHIQ